MLFLLYSILYFLMVGESTELGNPGLVTLGSPVGSPAITNVQEEIALGSGLVNVHVLVSRDGGRGGQHEEGSRNYSGKARSQTRRDMGNTCKTGQRQEPMYREECGDSLRNQDAKFQGSVIRIFC